MSTRHASDGTPHFGHTRRGHLPVHLHARDHLPSATPLQRLNARVAVAVTRAVGSMTCAYLFAAFDCLALPTAVHQGLYGIVQWTASFFLQLVLLSVIMVGQNLQASASDARAAKTFEDTEALMDLLSTRTPGGLTDVTDKLTALEAKVTSLPVVLGASAAGQLTRLEAAASRLEQALNGHAGAIRDQLASVRVDASAAHAGIQALSDMLSTIPQAAPEPPSAVPPAARGGTAGGEPAPAARRSPTEPRERM